MNKEYADSFFDYLNKLYEFNKNNNPNFLITPNMVYTILINYGVLERENVENLFNIWIERFKQRPGINVFRTDDFRYFCQFVNGNFNPRSAIKIYVPLKKHNLDENVTRIFDFIRSNNIMHYSKVAKEVRNDNVVIRVSNQKDATTIIDFINSNDDIKRSLNPVSPLTFSYKGIGVSRDGNLSYNMQLCEIISSCLNKKMKLNVNSFSNYLKQKGSNEVEPDRKMIYEIGSRVFKNLSFDDICNIEKKHIRNDSILFEVMNVTKEKYDIAQVKRALYEYICNSNPGYFSRGNDRNRDYRFELCSNLSSNDVLNVIKKKVGEISNINETIEKFVNSVYADEISRLKESENVSIDHYLRYLKVQCVNGNNDLVSLIKNQRINGDYSLILIQNKIIKQIYPNYSDSVIDSLFANGVGYNIIANLVMSQSLDKEDNFIMEMVSYYLGHLEEMYQLMNYNNFVLFVSNELLSKENINGIKRENFLRALLEYLYQGNYYLVDKNCKSEDVAVILAQLIKNRVDVKNNQKAGK